MYRRSIELCLMVMIAICAANVPMRAVPQSSDNAQAAAMKQYQDTVDEGDSLMMSGAYFEAVRRYEQAWRVAYNNKLKTDGAALDKKLAAARQARDAGQKGRTPASAPAAAAPPTSSPRESAPAAAAPSTSSPPTSAPAPRNVTSPAAPPATSGAALTPMQDYEQTVRYADELMAGGEPSLAGRQYERARRLVYNNKLAVDSAALDAKWKLATAAEKAGSAPSTEMVPAPPPPLPHPPGEEVKTPYLPQEPGKFLPWNLHREGFVVADTHATPAELKALEASLQRIAAVVKKAPLFNPPTGFDVYSSSTLISHEATADMKRALATNEPLMTDIFFSALGKFELHVRSKSTGQVSTRVATEQEVTCGLRFHVNTYPRVGVRYEDSEGIFFLEPRKMGEIGGLPVYEDMLVIARPGDTLWVPATRERILKWLLPKYKSDMEYSRQAEAGNQKNRAADLSPEQIAKWRQEEAAARAKGGAGAEQEARHLEAMHRRWEEDSRKALASSAANSEVPKRTQIYQGAQAMLADPASRTAPACIMTDGLPGAANAWRVVPTETPGCRLIVRGNIALFNPKLPRSALQVIHVDQITESTKYLESEKHLREDPGNCVAVSNLIRQLNWQELVGLLEK